MKAKRYRHYVVPTVVAHMLFAFASCWGSGASTRYVGKYDGLPYVDTFQFQKSQETVYRAAIASLQDMGGVITLSDPRTGLINAELSSIEEFERSAAVPAESEKAEGSGGIMAGIGVVVGFLLFILFFAWLADGCESGETTSAPRPRPRPDPSPPEPVVASKYILSLTITQLDHDSAEMRVLAMQQTIENGTVTQTVRLQNKSLNYSLRDAVAGLLSR